MDQQTLFDGKYRIIRPLGRGGSSSVFLAENVRLGTLWAIKEISKRQDVSAQFLAEPHVLKQLRHPALPRIFDIIENEAYLYLVQDYLEGDTLEDLIRRDGAIPERQLVQWALEICDVYTYLHNHQPHPIIYRDMKPGNLIVGPEGRIRLIDFGIARQYKAQAQNDTVCLGTRGYAAPEQYGGTQSSPRSDIYSLGVTLYHGLTGLGPGHPRFLQGALGSQEGPWDPGFGAIIDRAVRTDPAQRFQRAEDMAHALEQLHQSRFISVSASRNPHPTAGPLLFGVGSVESHGGATHHAVMLARYLAKSRRTTVALAEYNGAPCLGGLRDGQKPFREAGVMYFPGTTFDLDRAPDFKALREYSHAVLDLGCLKVRRDGHLVPTAGFEEMKRVHCPILVASGSPWRIGALLAFNYIGEDLSGWHLLITPTSQEVFGQIVPAASHFFNPRRIHHSRPEADPHHISREQEVLMERIVREADPPREKGFLGFLKPRR